MQFFENLNSHDQLLHSQALLAAKEFISAEAGLLQAIVEIDSAKVYEKFGLTYLTPYCVKYLNLTEEVAANFVRVARKSREIPELKAAVDGGLSVSKAKAIVSVITPENHQEWIALAQTSPKNILEKEIAKHSSKKAESERAKMKANDLVRVEFDLEEEAMKDFRRAQDLVSAKIGRFATLAETQTFLLKGFLKKEDPVVKADRARTDRSRERSTTAKQIPATVKHKVFQRDRGECQARLPNGSRCGEKKWIHLHHIKPQAAGGEHMVENLTTLCSGHHRLLHERD